MSREIVKYTEKVAADDDDPMRVVLSLARRVRNDHPEYEKYHWNLYMKKTDGEPGTAVVTITDKDAFPKINWWLVAGATIVVVGAVLSICIR